MGSALRLISFVAVLTQLSQATQSALELLSEEENEFHQRRLDFDDWCNREIANQEKQRKELSELQGDDTAEEIEQFEVSDKLLEVARQLQPSPVELKVANVTLTVLKAVQSNVAARAPRFFWRETRGLQAVQKLLQQATVKVSGFSLAQTLDRTSLEAQLEVLKAEQKNASEVLAARRAKVLAARSGRQVLETALAQTEASLSEAAGLCGLGRTVLNRSEATGQQLARKALELIGMVEGSPASASSIPVPASAAGSALAGPASTSGIDLLGLSKQLQLQQQQVQQQLEEVKQMKAAAATPKVELAEIESHESLQLEDPEPSKKVPARKKSKVPTMSLAAEATEESRNEVSHTKAEAVKTAQEATTPPPKLDLPAKSYKKESDEDSNRLQAPKDFPAALRGGWQALLAKKRAEGFKKSPAKTEEHSSIMDLMQTPKTYTAWQPDKGPPQPAEKAKQDLLAAEKAFDDDDSEKNMFNKKKSAQSFLQLDGDDGKVGLGDPLAFFQVGSMTDLASTATLKAPSHSEVGMLLEKFAEMTDSSTLLELSKSQLQTQDFEMLLQKLEAESDDDRSEEFCASVLPKGTSIEAKLKADLKKYYLDAKTRHEAEALQREVVAREHLVSVFGNTSQRFGAVQELLQHSFTHEEGRLQRLETQLVQLEATRSARSAAQELHEVLGQLRMTMRHAQEELEDTLASATSRQQQAEKLDQQSLQKLVLHVKKLEASTSGDSSPKLEKLCAMAAESRARRQEKQKMEVEALRTAKALNELL